MGVAELLFLLCLSPELERLHMVNCTANNSDKLFSRIKEEELCPPLTDIDFRELWKSAMFNYKSLYIYKFVETRASLPNRTPLRHALYWNLIRCEVQDLVRKSKTNPIVHLHRG